MTYVVGLTGGIGSGKSAVANLFAELGAEVVDTDAIAHALTLPKGAAIAQLVETFGERCLAPDGSMDRVAMRALVFQDNDARKKLEGILHPLIRQTAEERIVATRKPYVVLVVPLLVETRSFRDRVSRILVVDCDPETQVKRTVARSQLSELEVRRIVAAQATRSQRLDAADDVIDNDGPREALRPQVETLHTRYSKLALRATKSNAR